MKIKKIYIQNFKGIKGPKILNLDKEISFLTGPNGFGKTTIFDVIEICLIGEIYRVLNTSKVINGNTNVGKPFYQNEKGKDVLIKIFVELKNGDEKIIIAYDREKERKNKEDKANRPAKLYFDRFIEDYDEKNFENKIKGFENEITNTEINELLGLNKEKDIGSIYKIFNYLQQEENTYFLKKSEHERHGNLDFIFGTEKEKEEKEKIEDFKELVKNINDKLEEKIEEKIEENKKWKAVEENQINIKEEELKNIKNNNKIDFKRFFEEKDNISNIDKTLDFDGNELFFKLLQLDNNKLLKEQYLENISRFEEFFKNFSIEEYVKLKNKEKLENIRKKEKFLNYFILQKYDTKDENRILEEYNELYNFSEKENVLKVLIFKNFLKEDFYNNILRKKKIFLLMSDNHIDSSIEYYFLEKKINDKKYIEKIEEKNTLIKYTYLKFKILDKFLLGKIIKNKNEIKNKSDTYDYIKNDENNSIIKGIKFKYFYEEGENNTSKYEELEKIYNKFNYFENYLKKDDINKVKSFENIFYKLGNQNELFLKEFNKNKLKIEEIKKDLGEQEIIIKELKDLKENLINFFDEKLINNFDESCILCGTKEIIIYDNKNNNFKKIEKIKSFEIFKEFVNKKIETFGGFSKEKDKKINKLEENNKNILDEFIKDIKEYLKENNNNIELFKKLKNILNQEDYNKNYSSIIKLLNNEKDLFSLNKQEINFNQEIINIKEKLLGKYEKYNNLNTIIFDVGDFELKDSYVLDKFLKIEEIDLSNINEENFSEQEYEKKKLKILNSINNNVKDFDKEEYSIIKILINSDYLEKYKSISSKIDIFLKEEGEKEKFIISPNNFIDELDLETNKLKKYLEEKTEIYFNVYSKISNLKEIFDKNIKNIKKLEDILGNFEKFIDIEEYSININEKFLKNINEKRNQFFKNKIDIYKDLNLLNNILSPEDISVLLNQLQTEFKIDNLNDCILDKYNDYDNLDKYKNNIKKYIDIEIDKLSEILDNSKLLSNYINICKDTFKEDLDIIKKYQSKKNELSNKIKYIEFKYYELDNSIFEDDKKKFKKLKKEKESELIKLNKRQNKIKAFYEKTNNLEKIYSEKIKKYKESMIKAIKLPFFLYTAKILQNFQQGMGIFIDMNFETKSGEIREKETINFYSSGDSKNDVIHQLSSGQLSVVSIAFTLAVNNIYKISDELKFLNIDDPVQEMDSLNIHSFIELIRHNFKEYNFIISTHNDENAYFMKYKLEKLNRYVNIINVQNEFFTDSDSNLKENIK